MTDFKSLMIENKSQITAVIFVLLVTVGGGWAIAEYQHYLTNKRVSENIADAKRYLALRQEARLQYEDIKYRQVAASPNLQSQSNTEVCDKLISVAQKIGKITEFEVEQAAKDKTVVKKAQSASDKYSLKQAYDDIRNLAEVCDRQTSTAKYVEAMNSASNTMSPTSEEFYRKSQTLASQQAKSLSESCPYLHINEAAQKICDNQVDTMKKYAEANKLVVDAIEAGDSPMSVSDRANSLYDEANKPLDSSVYREVLDEDADSQSFLAKYVARLDERIDWL